MAIWRIIDNDVLTASENIAVNQAILRSRAEKKSPNTLRIVRFKPCVLIGHHQSFEQEVNLEYCSSHGIELQRRITGGGAIYLDINQIGWELYLDRKILKTLNFEDITAKICFAAARMFSVFGIHANFRPRNDIEVSGRKISGTGGIFEGNAFLYQGTVLATFNVDTMLSALRISHDKLIDKISQNAQDRVTSLANLLHYHVPLEKVKKACADAFSAEFDIIFCEAGLNINEKKHYEDAIREVSEPDWLNLVSKPVDNVPILEAQKRFPGGSLRVRIIYDNEQHRIKQLFFTGDFFVSPRRTIFDLEASLKNVLIDNLERTIFEFFEVHDVFLLKIKPDDFVSLCKLALSGTAQCPV